MATRNVVLTDRQEELIAALVSSGRYQNASEVLREGLRLIERREAEDAAKLEALKEAVRLGVASLEDGGGRTFSDGADLRAHLQEIGARAIASVRREG